MLTDEDVLLLACLNFIDDAGSLPDGCDSDELLRRGLIEVDPSGWALTDFGKATALELERVSGAA